MINELRSSLIFYIEHFSWIDWVAYLWTFLIFLAIFFTSIYIIGKSQILGFLMLFFSIFGFGIGVFFVSNFLDTRLRSRSIDIVSQKQLVYTDALIVSLDITNKSKKDFEYCRVKLKFYYPSQNKFKNLLNTFKPFNKENIVLHNLKVGEKRHLDSLIDGFRANKEYNITTNSECF